MWGRLRYPEMGKMLAEDSKTNKTMNKEVIGTFGVAKWSNQAQTEFHLLNS